MTPRAHPVRRCRPPARPVFAVRASTLGRSDRALASVLSVRALASVLVAGALALALVVLPTDAAAQSRPDKQFAVDPEILGGSLSYAWGGADGTYWGVGAGIGGSLLSTMVLAGRHFSEDGWISYEERDGATEKFLVELLHAEVFRRWSPSLRQEYDLGVRASFFIHSDSSDDDFGGGAFVGTYATAHWGWEHVKIGPRILVGYFTEGGSTQEFGVFVSPLTGRISFGW